MFKWIKKILFGEKKKPERETFLWCNEGVGEEQAGRDVVIDGRHGKVVAGTGLTIVVEWSRL